MPIDLNTEKLPPQQRPSVSQRSLWARLFRILTTIRTPLHRLTALRVIRGGRLKDWGRLPRYLGFFAMGAAAIWMPITGYLSSAPLSFRSDMSLILPGSGASASVNLTEIGQASSYANSAFASNAVSPTETYKRLLAAERIVKAAARELALAPDGFGHPRVELVDQTGLIHVSITGPSPEAAQRRLQALMAAFFSEIEALRKDEILTRESGAGQALAGYRDSVRDTRAAITRLQQDSGLISTEQYHALVREVDALEGLTLDLRAKLEDRDGAVRALEAVLQLTPDLAAAALRLHADSEFAALAAEVSERSAKLSGIVGHMGAGHPTREAAQRDYTAAAQRMTARATELTGLDAAQLTRLDMSHVGSRTELLKDLVTLGAERRGLQAEYATQLARLQDLRSRRDALITPAAQLEDLQRDFAVSEAVFASALARIQSSKADLFASYPLVQVLEDPSRPDVPSSPRRKLALAAGGAATFFLLIGLVLGWIRRPLIDRIVSQGDGSEDRGDDENDPARRAVPDTSVVPAE